MTGPIAGGFGRATALASTMILIAGCSTAPGDSTKPVARPSVATTSAPSTPPASPSAPASATPSGTPSTPTSDPASTPTPAVTSTSRNPVATIADGRYAARITTVSSRRRLVTFDVIQLFLGEAATIAAAQDHAPEVPPPNDVWIRNVSHRLRTLPVASAAPITLNVLSSPITGSSTKNLSVSLTRLGQFRDLEAGVFWLTVRHGVVTRITEQYLP